MNEPYRVIILDDEPPARDLMKVFIDRMPDFVCVATCSNAMQGLQAIQEHKPDLLLLDIQMPEMTGMELMSLPLAHRPEVILTTAYPEYALASYEFSVLDYLVKPIAFDRFVKSIVKFRQKRQQQSATNWSSEESAITSDKPVTELAHFADNHSVWLREEKRLLQIPFQDVLYIEGLRDYVKVFLTNDVILTHMGIGQSEKLFQPPQFIRIHRSFIVRKAAIQLIEGSQIKLINGKSLLLGPLYRDEVRKYIPVL